MGNESDDVVTAFQQNIETCMANFTVAEKQNTWLVHTSFSKMWLIW